MQANDHRLISPRMPRAELERIAVCMSLSVAFASTVPKASAIAMLGSHGQISALFSEQDPFQLELIIPCYDHTFHEPVNPL